MYKREVILLNRNIPTIGIIFIFILSAVTPIVFGYDVRISNTELINEPNGLTTPEVISIESPLMTSINLEEAHPVFNFERNQRHPIYGRMDNSEIFAAFKNLDWEEVVDKGFGNENNVFAWSMKAYNGYLYVGTRNIVNGCQIYRSQSGDKGTWEQVISDGFDNNNISEGARNMIVYKNLLWVVTDSWNHGTQVWITDGEDDDEKGVLNWKKVNENGFGEGKNVPSSRAITIYKDKLYIGARGKDGPRIYSYNGPTDFENIQPSNWSLINVDLIDDPTHNPNLVLVGTMINFTAQDEKEYLYVGIYQEPIPLVRELKKKFTIKNLLKLLTYVFWKCEIWRYDGDHWREIIEDGFGGFNVAAISAQVLNGSLYFGTSSILGTEIWKTEDGEKWFQIVKRGFGYPFTEWSWIMHIYENRLIIGTFNPIVGCQIWASVNENPNTQRDFIQINKNGMDCDKIFFSIMIKQDGVRTLETFKGHMYAGTASFIDLISKAKGTGCEVWRIDHLSDYSDKNH